MSHKLQGLFSQIADFENLYIAANEAKKGKRYRQKESIEIFLKEKLGLDLNNKTAIRPISTGIEFVGFRMWATHRRLKKKTLKKMKRRIKTLQKAYSEGSIGFDKVNSSMQSYFGIMEHFNSFRFKTKLLNECVFSRNEETTNQER